jgi:hypothetical protein
MTFREPDQFLLKHLRASFRTLVSGAACTNNLLRMKQFQICSLCAISAICSAFITRRLSIVFFMMASNRFSFEAKIGTSIADKRLIINFIPHVLPNYWIARSFWHSLDSAAQPPGKPALPPQIPQPITHLLSVVVHPPLSPLSSPSFLSTAKAASCPLPLLTRAKKPKPYTLV